MSKNSENSLSMKEKILLAMSGGLDSSVSAYLLQEQGFEVIGVTFIMFDDKETGEFRDYVNDARIVADMLNMKHYVKDIREDFNKKIISYFVDSYMNGLTPNPCALCNPKIKFKTLIDFADELGIEYVSTGHYAIIKKENGRFFVSKPADDWKDQTYFLWRLSQEYLRRTILPLSELTKDQVRQIAVEQKFTNLIHKRESYDVCFVAGDNYRAYLDRYLKEKHLTVEEGDFVTEDGKVVGRHKGITHYTVGQRKGLGIAMGVPYFVKKIDKESNRIIVAPRENTQSNSLIINDINLMKYEQLPTEKRFLTKIRFRDGGHLASVKIDENKAIVTFDEPVFGVAPGQSAVFYEGNDLVGGGVIV